MRWDVKFVRRVNVVQMCGCRRALNERAIHQQMQRRRRCGKDFLLVQTCDNNATGGNMFMVNVQSVGVVCNVFVTRSWVS